MFDAGFAEVLLIFVIGLLILGPERLPRVAAQLGRWLAKARRTANQLRWQLEREVALDDIYRSQKKKPQRPVKAPTAEQGASAAGDEDSVASSADASDADSGGTGSGAATNGTGANGTGVGEEAVAAIVADAGEGAGSGAPDAPTAPPTAPADQPAREIDAHGDSAPHAGIEPAEREARDSGQPESSADTREIVR